MALGFEQLVSKLQVRFDYYSSRSVARDALARAGLKEQSEYSDAELQKFVDGLNAVSTNLAKVWTAIGVAPSGEPLPAPPAPKIEVKPPPPKPEPVVEAAPEPVVEAAPEPVFEPAAEPVVEAAPEAEPVAEAAPEVPAEEGAQAEEPAHDAWFGGKKKKKKKGHEEAASEAPPEGETPSEG